MKEKKGSSDKRYGTATLRPHQAEEPKLRKKRQEERGPTRGGVLPMEPGGLLGVQVDEDTGWGPMAMHQWF